MGRKPISGLRKFSRMVIRLTDEEKVAIDSAAEREGATTSSWARDILLRAAQFEQDSSTEVLVSPKKRVKKSPPT